jgi:hypothetical protein
MSGQTIEDLREVAAALPGALQLASRENDTLKRQVEVLANDMARTAPPENYPNHYDDWLELLFAERVQWWVKWSLEQAKKGGGE